MTQSHQEMSAEKALAHIIGSQTNLFGQLPTTPEAAERLALFCATFVHAYKTHLIDITNKSFPKKQP